MWTMKVPVISTSHLTRKTADSMPVWRSEHLVAAYQHGWFIFVPSNPEECDLPEDLQAVMVWFRNHPDYRDEYWLRIDADAGEVDGLPTYVW